MTRPIVYLAITNHGFGHATRLAAAAAALQTLRPDVLLVAVTTAPRWLLGSYLPGEFLHRPRGFDIGVVQSDSLTMDKTATREKLEAIRQRQGAIVAAETDFIRQMSVKNGRVELILADIPPLATAIARAADLPCWMVGNFGWDFIYRDWGAEFDDLVTWIEGCFAQCDRLFRLPFHEPMSAFPAIEDVGLTGGDPRFSPEDLRDRLGLPDAPRDRTVLMTFGGLGLQQVPYETLTRFPDWLFITFDRSAPPLPNLHVVADPTDATAESRAYRPVDFMPLCGRVLSKPGYSTFSEACRLDVPVASVTREGFAEAPILIDGLRQQARHQILSPAELLSGDWAFLDRPLEPPQRDPAVPPLAKDGNGAIARAVAEFLS